MEKLVYLLLGPSGSIYDRSLLAELRPVLVPPAVRAAQVNLVDSALGHPFGVAPPGGSLQILARVSAWVDSAEQAAPALTRALEPTVPAGPADGEGPTWHGWLVCESEPVPNRTHPPDAEGLVPGFTQVVALSRPAQLSWGEWRRIWQGSHTSVAINTQSTFRYVQNVVFRAVTPGAPAYVAIVEESFPAEAASDLHVFFASGGDDARLSRHMAAMSESCDRFMDGDAPVSWTREWQLPD